MKTVLAFDFGASSGRAILAKFDGKTIDYREIHRFDNVPLEQDGLICHNVPMILDEIKTAIQKAGPVDALAFDTWGVDYGLLDADGNLVHLPVHYRDPRTNGKVSAAGPMMDANTLYQKTGNQIMEINTLFQLLAESRLKQSKTLLFMPDLFAYLLTGNAVCEESIASTSQMLNPNTRQWDEDVLRTFSIPTSLFAPLQASATRNGTYRGIQVLSVAGHDTQCAVAAMPSTSSHAAFLSCGTWSLIGCELDTPVLSAESRELELSNELGANGKINYLKNISGLWLIQETKRDLKKNGLHYSYNDLEMLARDAKPFQCFIDPDTPMLAAHGQLPEKIKAYCRQTGQYCPQTVGEVVRCIYESLALKYRLALAQISTVTKQTFDVLHILGGGTKDGFLCEMTANSVGIPVVAGPIEATALGNIILQLLALGEIKSVEEGRAIIAKTETTKSYAPCHTSDWDMAYDRYCTLLNTENK